MDLAVSIIPAAVLLLPAIFVGWQGAANFAEFVTGV